MGSKFPNTALSPNCNATLLTTYLFSSAHHGHLLKDLTMAYITLDTQALLQLALCAAPATASS